MKIGEKQPGLYPTIQKMPYTESLLKVIVEEFGFEKDYSIKCLEANRHNHITATYHLLQKKSKRNQKDTPPKLNENNQKNRGRQILDVEVKK